MKYLATYYVIFTFFRLSFLKMCSIFTYKLSTDFLKENFNFSLHHNIEGRVVPYTLAPTLYINVENKKLEIKQRNFSLVPAWAKGPKVKFATHNARLFGEDRSPIFSKPTWKIPFTQNHCLVLMDSFTESVYEGPYAGNLINFRSKDGAPLLVASIFDTWVNKATGEVLDSFSLLTHEPPAFVREAGHDRCPVFLSKENAKIWLCNNDRNAQDNLLFLTNHIREHDLSVSIERPLKNFSVQGEFKF